MSCRIVSSVGAVGAKPLFEREAVPVVVAAPENAPHAEVAELHDRIAGLERCLKRDVQQARETGFREGEIAGRERTAAEIQPVIERVTRSLAELASVKSRLRRDAEHDLVELSISIARRILRRELTVDPEAVGGLVRAALDKLQARDVCRVRVHPDHHMIVRRQLDQQGGGSAEVVADAALQLGDVVVETKRGDLEASVESQLSEIERGFADRLRRWES